MPFQLPNFLNAPIVRGPKYTPDHSGIVNFIPNALEAYNNPFKMRHERMINEEKYNEAAMKNAILKEHGMDKAKAEVNLKNAQAQHYLNPWSSNARDIIEALGGIKPGSGLTKEQKEAILNYQGVDTETTGNEITSKAMAANVDPEVVGPSFKNRPANIQLGITKELQANKNKAKSMTAALSTLDHMGQIMDKYPNLWKGFTLALSKPDDKEGVAKFIKSNAVNEKEKTAIDVFRKLSADLVLQGGEALGSNQRFTDAKQQLLSQAKPDVANTSAANKFLINKMKDLMGVGPEWEKALQFGIDNQRIIRDKPEIFKRSRKEKTDTSASTNLGISSGQDMVQVRNRKTGQVQIVSKEEAERLRGGQ